MRAAVFKGIGLPMVIEQLPDPTPDAGEVVLQVGRCGICSSDFHFTDGRSDTFRFEPGSVLGHEYSGTIVATGSGVTRVKVGDNVACMPHCGCGRCGFCLGGRQIYCDHRRASGGYAEYVLHHENAMVRMPSSLSMADGALVEPVSVALRGVTLASMPLGSRVLVLGAGPIGLAAAFWARRLGAGRMAVATPTCRREQLAQSMGADSHILTGDERGLAVAAREALGGAPNVVFDCVGSPGSLATAITAAHPGGTVVVLGVCIEADSIMPAEAAFKELRLQFSMVYDIAEFEHSARVLDRGAIELRGMVTGSVGLDAFPAEFEALRNSSDHCKVMLDPWA